MLIPIRPASNALEYFERPRMPHVPVEPAVAKTASSILAVGGLDRPSGKDVSFELDRLFIRLTTASEQRRASAPVVGNRSALPTGSTLASSGELNADTTSYSKTRLTFGGSTSVATLSGTYNGNGAAVAASSLKVEINQGAGLGANPAAIRFTVTDQAGAELFSYNGMAKAGESITLGSDIGLQIAFSAGNLLAQTSATTAVSRTKATLVDPLAAFDAVDPNQRPRFENGAQVSAGSFTLNGQRIEVRADDSITAVLQRISENVPNIAATFSEDRVLLRSLTNSKQPIVVSSDTSGFLAATKLQGGVSVAGSAARGDERLALQAQFSGVQAGGFRVGGRFMSVDPAVDTVGSVLERMRESVPGLMTFVDPDSKEVVLRAKNGDRLMLEDDTSGFLAALGLTMGPAIRAREHFVLDAGVAHRLQRAAHSEKAQLVNRTLAALTLPEATTTEVEELAGRAKAALAAYDRAPVNEAAERERAAARSKARDWPPDTEPTPRTSDSTTTSRPKSVSR